MMKQRERINVNNKIDDDEEVNDSDEYNNNNSPIALSSSSSAHDNDEGNALSIAAAGGGDENRAKTSITINNDNDSESEKSYSESLSTSTTSSCAILNAVDSNNTIEHHDRHFKVANAMNIHRRNYLGFAKLGNNDEDIDYNSSVLNFNLFTSGTNNAVLCECFKCHRLIGFSRYAPHLEKCSMRISSTRNPPRNYYSNNQPTTSLGTYGSSTGSVPGSSITPQLSLADGLSGDRPDSANSKKRPSSALSGRGPLSTMQLSALLSSASSSKRQQTEKGFYSSSSALAAANAQSKLPLSNDIICIVCGKLEKPENMALCDGCCSAFHLHCANSGVTGECLSTIPGFPWFCSKCSSRISTPPPASAVSSKPRSARDKIENDGRVVATFEITKFCCDVCKKVIHGYRWRCLTCPEFDVCQSCKQLNNYKKGCNSSHPFVKLQIT